MIRRPLSYRWTIGLGVISVALLVGAYTILAMVKHAENPRIRTIPTWAQIAEGVKRATTPQKQIWRGEGEPPVRIWLLDDAKATYGRLAAGLAVGVLVSIVLGMLMGTWTPAAAFFLPPLKFLAKIPPTAMMAIFFALAGIGLKMYLAMIAFGVLPTLTQSVYRAAAEGVPNELINKSLTLGASRVEVIWNVIFRQVLPDILEATRLQVGPAMVYLIAAEMLVGDVGFGYRIRLQTHKLDMSVVYFYLVILGATGFAIDYFLRLASRKLCPWYQSS